MDTQLAKIGLTMFNTLLISLKTSPLVKRIGIHVFKQFHVFTTSLTYLNKYVTIVRKMLKGGIAYVYRKP